MTDLSSMQIKIIGAGIGGLTAACALAQQGARVTVLERAPALEQVGAGIQISANACSIFERLGIWADFQAISLSSPRVELRDTAARLIATVELERFRPGGRFRMVHRAALIALLANAALRAGAEIVLDHSVSDLPDADLVIGADGVKSMLRPLLNGPETPFFTGQTAWRALIAAEPAAEPVPQVFMGAGRHLVSYPLAEGMRNIVAVLERPEWHHEGWTQQGDAAELRAAFARFGGPVPGWLERVEQTNLWGLFRHPVASHWWASRSETAPLTALMGDAAHPSLPFMAQGAAMAIEDAWVLATCLADQPDQLDAALSRYQALRQPRCIRITDAANANATNFHLRGPTRAVAHAGLRAVSRLAPGRLVERFSWIYDYDATQLA